MHPPVPRTWTVELRPQHGGPALYCPRCSPGGQALQATSARPAALAHLARHARSDALPTHLRTCQCHERGCRWHPRHRGCAGPILLVLTREHGGRTWRLADICAACAAATPHAAIVPETALMSQHSTKAAISPRKGKRSHSHGPSEQALVRDTLSYLAASLPGEISTQTRLLALQCSLRAGACGRVRLPNGLLRGMQLSSSSSSWQELEEARWLRLCPGQPPAVEADLLEHFGPLPARRDRLRAADWALRTVRAAHIRRLSGKGGLLALALAAHLPAGSTQGMAEVGRLCRDCALAPQELASLMEHLQQAGQVETWLLDPTTEDVTWIKNARHGPPDR
jgi:hypothetical protein